MLEIRNNQFLLQQAVLFDNYERKLLSGRVQNKGWGFEKTRNVNVRRAGRRVMR